jgi:hypothetical protein
MLVDDTFSTCWRYCAKRLTTILDKTKPEEKKKALHEWEATCWCRKGTTNYHRSRWSWNRYARNGWKIGSEHGRIRNWYSCGASRKCTYGNSYLDEYLEGQLEKSFMVWKQISTTHHNFMLALLTL